MKRTLDIPEPQTEAEIDLLAFVAAKLGKVQLGNVVITQLVRENFTQPFLVACLTRHRLTDWGEVDAEDWEANDSALQNDARLLSVYSAPNGEKLWMITEWDRKTTTLLMPEEY